MRHTELSGKRRILFSVCYRTIRCVCVCVSPVLTHCSSGRVDKKVRLRTGSAVSGIILLCYKEGLTTAREAAVLPARVLRKPLQGSPGRIQTWASLPPFVHQLSRLAKSLSSSSALVLSPEPPLPPGSAAASARARMACLCVCSGCTFVCMLQRRPAL